MAWDHNPQGTTNNLLRRLIDKGDKQQECKASDAEIIIYHIIDKDRKLTCEYFGITPYMLDKVLKKEGQDVWPSDEEAKEIKSMRQYGGW